MLYVLLYIHYIFIYTLYNCCSISNYPKCSIGKACVQTIKDEKITLCEYATKSFLFYTFVRHTFQFYLKSKGKTVTEYKILKYRKLKMI